MATRNVLLKIAGKAALNVTGAGGLWATLAEKLPELSRGVWDEWSAARTSAERRVDLEAVAMLGDEGATEVEAILTEIAADRPAADREELSEYLTQIPTSVRQTLRRPDDPLGLTVPTTRAPQSGRDMIPFLRAQRPRFRAGDRPIPGGDWELVELLGIGGYGEVWKAKHTLIDDFKPVALKFCTHPLARERLLKHEARLCARVQREGNHPGIVSLRNTYLSADPPCLAYDYVDGGTLAGLIKEQARRDPRPTTETVTRQLLEIAEIVAFAHRLDPPIVHRDLKPANILVRGSGEDIRFLITDFGIGGIATAGVIRATHLPTHPSLLLTNAVNGSHTPLYASPEQAAGGDPDPRDDVHALGVIWYQMVTGDLTSGRPGGSTWRKRFAQRGMPPELIDLLDSCFDEAPERIADATILRERIEAMLTPTGTDSPRRADPIGAAPAIRGPDPIAPPAPTPSGELRAKPGESARFEGHGDEVNSVAFAPDGRSALSGSSDGTMRLWDVATGREIRRFEGHQGGVVGVAFAPDGRTVLSGSSGGSIRLWDVANGLQLRRFGGHDGWVTGVAFAPDGRSALSGSLDDTARLWDVATGLELRRFEGHHHGVTGVAFAPDGRTALSGSLDDTIRLWDVAAGHQLRRFEGHQGGVHCVAFAPDGGSALFGSGNGSVRIWSLATGGELRQFKGEVGRRAGWVTSVAFARDGRSALSGSADGTARLWDVASGHELRRFEGHGGGVSSVAFAPDGRSALSGSADGTVRLWDLPG